LYLTSQYLFIWTLIKTVLDIKQELIIIITKELIAYSNRIINIKMELVRLTIEKRIIKMFFNILLLRNNKAVLGIP